MAPAQIQILRRPVKLPPVELPKETRVKPPPDDLPHEQPLKEEKREGLKILTKPKPPTPETTEEVKQKEGRAIRKTEWAEELDINAPSGFENIKEPAMVYPFELDSFQKQAIVSLESGHHVFVSAHTSAGKTVVAEYAIALSKRNRSSGVLGPSILPRSKPSQTRSITTSKKRSARSDLSQGIIRSTSQQTASS